MVSTTPAILTIASASDYVRAFFSTGDSWVSSLSAAWMPGEDAVTVRGTYDAERRFPFSMDVWVEARPDGSTFLYGEY